MQTNVEPQFNIPTMALRGIVVYPKTVVHFDVVRKKSIEALNIAMAANRRIFLVTQRDISVEEPLENDLYTIGCVAKIRQIARVQGDVVRVLVEGCYRAELKRVTNMEPALYSDIVRLDDEPIKGREVYNEALLRNAKSAFDSYAHTVPKIAPDVIMEVVASDDIGHLADFITHNLPVDYDDKQYILEQLDPKKRLKLVITLLKREKEIMTIDAKINEKVRGNIDQNQREYYLREQLKVINEELYGNEGPEEECDKYYRQINELKASDEVKKRLREEVDRYLKMPSGSHEATVVLNYIDTCLSLPWGVYTEGKIDLVKSQKILDREHFGLKKVKERIIELLAVHTLVPEVKGQIICLVGPPGVGKTSIVKSVAECMGRKYARVALGGVGDEAEIRGHRKTYIGAMPGRIINALKQAGSSNAVILLDEIDKLGSSYKGDPSSAMLEILDSEQNGTFFDHYVDMPFDLSRTLFITTANDAGEIPGPLLDRMELIELGSYTREEKFQIAKRHLVKKQIKAVGLTASQLKFSDEAIYKLIDAYTREAGVRRLDRVIAKICRKAAAKIVSGEERVKVTVATLHEMLGTEKYKPDVLQKKDEIGLVNGLAWTSVGGELLQMEVACVPGTGKIELTGSLGDVMKESAHTAITCVRSRADMLGIDKEFYKNLDIHIHAPEAAVPKDGPSAGVTMVTAIVSALTGTPVRRDVAMTGEVTLRGRVMPIGGLKEKSMAAYRNGIKKVFIPIENLPNLDEVDDIVKENVEFKAVETIDELLPEALVSMKKVKEQTPSMLYNLSVKTEQRTTIHN